MIKHEIKKLIDKDIDFTVEKPRQQGFGDYSSNIAMVLAKKTGKNPVDIAEEIKSSIKTDLFEKIEIINGFINFYLSKEYLQSQVKEIMKHRKLDIGKGKKVQVEFISANPTGPLTVANARGGPIGDVLANVLNNAGFKAEKAFYINNRGNQIEILGHSVLKDDKAEYKGEYIDELHKKIKEKDPYKAGQEAAELIVQMIKKTADKMGIKYDEWISEDELYTKGKVDKCLEDLKDFLYEKDGAVWFRSSHFGDHRDRVIVKSDGRNTYLAGDFTLHKRKFKKFDKAINIWGADHHGDVPGLLAGVEAMGHKGKLDIVLYQFVTVLEKGEKIRMSKRTGNFIPMDQLLDEVGSDAVRFFFLLRGSNTHLNFDMDLAKEQSEKNPVYYVQYAYARISSILSKAKKPGMCSMQSLVQEPELDLIKQLIRMPEIIEDIVRDYEVDRLTRYSLDVAKSFHRFYQECHVMCDEKNIRKARLSLILATRNVLKQVLDLMGISAPEKM